MNWLRKLTQRHATPPSVGEGRRVIAVGDIHGRADLLDQLLERLLSYAANAPDFENTIVFLGDYIDRGMNSREVIQRLVDNPIPGWKMVCLRGNHDQSMLDFVKDPAVYRNWRQFGAPETLFSYGVRPPLFDRVEDFARARDDLARACPLNHWEFLGRLRYFHVEGDYVFVHAGIRPGVALVDQTPEDMMWIRDEFLAHRQKFPKVVVHGHTPSPRAVHLENRIGIDTGAHATDRLTAVIFEGARSSFLSTGPQATHAFQLNNVESAEDKRARA